MPQNHVLPAADRPTVWLANCVMIRHNGIFLIPFPIFGFVFMCLSLSLLLFLRIFFLWFFFVFPDFFTFSAFTFLSLFLCFFSYRIHYYSFLPYSRVCV